MIKISSNRTRIALLLLAVTLSLGGCGTKKEMKTSNTAPPSQSVAPATTESRPPSSTPAPATSSAPAIATADGDLPGTKVEVQELKRSAGTVMLKFAMINNSAKALNFGYTFGDGTGDYDSVGGIDLIDSIGKKKYFVVRDTENTCACSRGVKDIAPGSRANLWAKFPAPPDDVQKISVVIPHFTPMDDVPISK